MLLLFLVFVLSRITLYAYCDETHPILIHCRAHRTALCKSKRGNFKDTYPDDLLAPVLRVCLLSLFYLFIYFPLLFVYGIIFLVQALIEKTNLDPSEVGDIVVGTVLAPGSQRASECRMSAFYAGFPGMFLIYTAMRIFVSVCCVLMLLCPLVQKPWR